MAYVTAALDLLYDADPEGLPHDLIGEWLSKHEAEGYVLVAVVPDHQRWDDKGEPAGKVGSILILHKSDEPPPGQVKLLV